MKNGFFALVTASLLTFTALADESSFIAAPKEPTTGPTKIYGAYNLGCIDGAKKFPTSGNGYEVMRASRNRYYGHPTLLQLLTQFSVRFGQTSPILFGDFGQPRGGPMPSGHASHQIGLDADIWLMRLPQWQERFRETLDMKSIVKPDGKAVDDRFWSDEYGEWIRWVALNGEVERIFVNPAIKKRLCIDYNEAKWLKKVRPWFGHDAHFHVRLRCPADQPRCVGQQPPDAVECGKELDSWFEPAKPTPVPPGPTPAPTPRPKLPAECKDLLGTLDFDIDSFDVHDESEL